jgi:hypothetical protein
VGVTAELCGKSVDVGPDPGADKESEMKGAKPNEVMQSCIAKAILLVQLDIQETMTDEFAAKANRMKVDGSVIRELRTQYPFQIRDSGYSDPNRQP